MTQWQPFEDKDTYYILVDSKPAEIVDTSNPNTIFCTAFVDTASCILGARNADLPWFKQYKECESLVESKYVIKELISLINKENFADLKVSVLSARFSDIDITGTNFIKGIGTEISDLKISDDYVTYKKLKYNIDKAKMLAWYNFCLCTMAPRLVDRALSYKKKRAVFLIDRLGDSDKRIQEFMQMIMKETSMYKLWKRCAEDHENKPKYVGYELPSHLDENGKIIAAANSMQSSLVDWVVLAAYAAKNGQENRDPEFQQLLLDFIDLLDDNNQLKDIHFNGLMTWE